MVSKKELAKMKRALKRLRKEKLKQLESELDKSFSKEKIEKEIEKKIKALKKQAFKHKPEQLAYETLAEICNELSNAKRRQVRLLAQIYENLKEDFIERRISTREYLYMAGHIKKELEYQKVHLAALKRTLDESINALAIFKKVPSFLSASHKRESRRILVPGQCICKIFDKKKLEQLRELEKELMALYGLTNADIEQATMQKEPIMPLSAIEKKVKRAIMLAQKPQHAIHKEREKERVAEIIAELRKYAEMLA